MPPDSSTPGLGGLELAKRNGCEYGEAEHRRGGDFAASSLAACQAVAQNFVSSWSVACGPSGCQCQPVEYETSQQPHEQAKVQQVRMFEFAAVGRESGTESFVWRPQTPQFVADQVEGYLRDPGFLDGGDCFAVIVTAAPEGKDPEEAPGVNYIQSAGSYEALTVEIRVTEEDESYVHYAVAREPIADPEQWTEVSWDAGGNSRASVQLHPEEVFTGEQAVPVYRAYIERGELPPAHLLREIDV